MPNRSAPEPLLIQKQQQIDDLCREIRKDGRFGFDTEFVTEDRFASDVCLIQIATTKTVAIIDPLLGLDIEPVWNLVGDERIETVVHAGQEDLALAVQHTGKAPRRLFDLQIAAGFAGLDYPISLQRLVQALLHIRLHKSKTLTNWRRRPLTADQVRYAAEDVVHLLEVHTRLQKRIEQFDRTAWVHEEMCKLEAISAYQPQPEERLARLKGTGSLDGRQLAVVGRILAWRDETAQRINQPARVLLKDHLLVEIAKHGIASVPELRELRGINLSDRNARGLCEVVKEAQALPSSEWPTPKPRETESPREATLIALATAVARSYCLDNNLAYGLVATQKSLKDLVRHCAGQPSDGGDDIALLRGWRGESVGKTLQHVLTGRMSVHVEPVHNGRALHIVPLKSSIAKE